jgi:hypothetical protein
MIGGLALHADGGFGRRFDAPTGGTVTRVLSKSTG